MFVFVIFHLEKIYCLESNVETGLFLVEETNLLN